MVKVLSWTMKVRASFKHKKMEENSLKEEGEKKRWLMVRASFKHKKREENSLKEGGRGWGGGGRWLLKQKLVHN